MYEHISFFSWRDMFLAHILFKFPQRVYSCAFAVGPWHWGLQRSPCMIFWIWMLLWMAGVNVVLVSGAVLWANWQKPSVQLPVCMRSRPRDQGGEFSLPEESRNSIQVFVLRSWGIKQTVFSTMFSEKLEMLNSEKKRIKNKNEILRKLEEVSVLRVCAEGLCWRSVLRICAECLCWVSVLRVCAECLSAECLCWVSVLGVCLCWGSVLSVCLCWVSVCAECLC